MRYFGSKTSTVETIHQLVSENVSSGSFCDPFGGIGTVSSFFQSKGYNIWSGDNLTFPFYFQIARLSFNYSTSFKTLFYNLGINYLKDLTNYLNSCAPKRGWFSREYSEKRNFFKSKNALKIQACRHLIKKWSKKRLD